MGVFGRVFRVFFVRRRFIGGAFRGMIQRVFFVIAAAVIVIIVVIIVIIATVALTTINLTPSVRLIAVVR